jgi:hypothetical protein
VSAVFTIEQYGLAFFVIVDAMPKPGVTGAVRRRQQRRTPAELSDAIEGQIAEICRDVAVQVKRLRQLQERTDELRIVIREWARESVAISDHEAP